MFSGLNWMETFRRAYDTAQETMSAQPGIFFAKCFPHLAKFLGENEESLRGINVTS